MSVEDTAAAIRTVEQNVEVQQELSNVQSAVENINIRLEAEADVEQPQVSVKGISGSSSSVHETSEETFDATESTRPYSSQEDDVEAAGYSIEDTQERSVSGGGCVTEATDALESQQGGATDALESQQDGASSRVGNHLSLESASIVERCTESLMGVASFTDSELPGIVCSSSIQDSPDRTTGSFSNKGLQETGGSSRRSSMESDTAGEVFNGLDSHDTATISSSCTGDSQETAIVGDSSRRASLESGVAGGVSNTPDSQESPAFGSESWQVLPAADGAIPLDGLRAFHRAVPRENVDERQQIVQDVMRGYDHCFSICGRVCDFLRPYSRLIRNSNEFLWTTIILILISIALIIKGFENIHRCPVKHELPILMMLLGIVGFVILVGCLVISRSCYRYVNRYYLLAGTITARLVFLGLFGAVVNSTYTISPSFDNKESRNYCDIDFYYFAYSINFFIAGVIVLALCIFVPIMTEDYEEF